MAQSSYLGVDIGTTSTKTVLFNKQGKVITSHTINYPLYTPNPLVAEQNPDEIFDAVVDCMREVMKKNTADAHSLQFVSFSSAMHSVIAVDENNHALTNSITWADTRSAEHAQQIKEQHNGHEIYMRTGTPIHAMSPLAKLVWLRDTHPDTFAKAAKFISIKEYVFYKLFGEYVVDHSIASATGLMNLESLDWDKEAMQLAGITADQLSTLVPTTHQMTTLKDSYRSYVGFDSEVPFIVGASDGVLSNLGVNAIEPGVIAVTIGTSGAIRTVADQPRTDPKGRIFCYALTENHWIIGGPVNNGGIILRWLRDEFAAAEVETAKRLGIDSYDVLTKIASGVQAGSDGLIFHPYMTGERAPLWNENARGSFFGLSIHHKKEHMIRAVLEGIIYNLYTVLLALEELTGEPKQIQATGGFARSEMWRQLMANIFDKPVIVPESYESSCLGAIVLGMYAVGEIDDFRIVSDMIGQTHTHHPDETTTNVYRELLPVYIRLSRIFGEEYDSITAFQRKYVKETDD
ncbi:gluconokinase [Virgibacillus phasianinus]|uniref:Gluconokinase n=1 Tax=Virgibacillus phasianinus TaxID=2017483 RepID=A0A220U1K8_9BACI|nr:gluconokinase [Virgibacillus phasianinus]ASK61970.1 gluconokinase [Virgibacillus phasianinus]